MMRLLSYYILLSLFISTFFFAGMSFCGENEFHDNKLFLYSKTLQEQSVEVKLNTAEWSESIPFRKGFRWGAELRPPKAMLTSVEVRVGKKAVFIPLSAFCDLADPRAASLSIIKDGMKIIIEGGDASLSYIATLRIINGYIESRTVRHREFPKIAWEKTTYSFNTGQAEQNR